MQMASLGVLFILWRNTNEKVIKACNEPGCPQLTRRGYCEQHKTFKPFRESSSRRGYNIRWHKAREGYLRMHSLCQSCMLQGKRVAATVVDHIKPYKGDKKLFWDSSNWQPLCAFCHSRKTAK